MQYANHSRHLSQIQGSSQSGMRASIAAFLAKVWPFLVLLMVLVEVILNS